MSIFVSLLLSHHVRRRHQNDFFIRDNAIEKFFRVLNMTRKNEKSINFHEFLTLRRNRERRIKFNRFDFNRHLEENSQELNK